MKNKLSGKIIVLLICSAFLTLGFFVKFNKKHDMIEHKKDLYYCPMHPKITSDKPGTCPICYMKLVKREQPNDSTNATTQRPNDSTNPKGYSTIHLDESKRQIIGIKTAKVEKKNLIKTIHTYGYVAHDLELYEAQIEFIQAWQAFYPFLTRRPIKGDFQTNWREYYAKEAPEGRWRSDDKLKAQQRLLKAEYELLHMGLTIEEMNKLREVKYGQPWIQPELLFFDDNNQRWIYAQIFERDLGYVDVGQKVTVTIPAYLEKTEGIVKSVTPFIDPQTRTVRVRVEVPNYRSELSVNMYVNLDFPVELDESLVIPREAIMDTGLNKIVFVQVQEGKFEPRNIQTGFEGDGMVAVRSGLKEGETIVVSGNFLLDSESRLQGALSGGHNHD